MCLIDWTYVIISALCSSFKYVSLNLKNKEANFQKDLVVSDVVPRELFRLKVSPINCVGWCKEA
jgi:hypothetical protein